MRIAQDSSHAAITRHHFQGLIQRHDLASKTVHPALWYQHYTFSVQWGFKKRSIFIRHRYYSYMAFRNSCFWVTGLPHPSSSSFPVVAISQAFSASAAPPSSTKASGADRDELLLRMGVLRLKKAVVDESFGISTRNRRGRKVGRQAVTRPAQSSPNDHPAGAMLLYVGSSPRFKNSIRTTDMTHVLS